MSKDCNHSNILLKRNGMSQNQRYIDALDPNALQLHDFSLEDWMAFAYNFAQNVNYFNIGTNQQEGNWQDFLIQKDAIKASLEKAEINKDLAPQVTLLVCFLRLLALTQDRLNQLSKRHLDFYYKEVLKLNQQDAVADQVHLLFELAKNTTELRIAEDTAADAGKDANGTKRIYKTENELIANTAKVSVLKNVFHDTTGAAVKFSEIANSYDGLGADFPDNTIKWWPFGHPNFNKADAFPDLPNAKLGFAIASPLLLLKEGERSITFIITLPNTLNKTINPIDFKNGIEILLSGEKKWIPATLDPSRSKISNGKLILNVNLSAATEAVVPYNKEVLLENFNSTNPIARFLFKTSDDASGYHLYDILKNQKLTNVEIEVEVKGMQDLLIENDLGRLDASKPFFPFGPQPVRDSKLYIGCQEALNKPWSQVSLDFQWKDTPYYGIGIENFREHYVAYRKGHLNNLGKDKYTLTTAEEKNSESDGGLIVETDDYFKVSIETLRDTNWDPNAPNKTLFISNGDSYRSNFIISPVNRSSAGTTNASSTASTKAHRNPIFRGRKERQSMVMTDVQNVYQHTQFQFQTPIMQGVFGLFTNPIAQENYSSNSKIGFIRMTLEQSFLHQLFPKIYAVALSKRGIDTLIPNAPYTPLAESLQIGYKASVSKNFDLESTSDSLKTNLTNYLDESIELFHEHPFGQSEQHTYLKSKHDFIQNTQCQLVPTYEKGQLFIGLENAEILQQISLLVQVLEGSENPEYDGENTFEGSEKLEWYILCDDEWKPLNNSYIISNNTDNFLKSGLVKIAIPKEATKNNHRITGNSFWLKIHNPKKFDTVCQVVGIHAQAELAEFSNNNNELSHLETGLPAETISKLVERPATLKKVIQPYSSFGGVPQETDSQFYRRISERLRHKQRAITLWDYEHLILQHFPKIYKANCLKHTYGNSELSPGNVTVVVVPNIIKQNIFDIYKPRISKAKRNEIQAFINNLNTLHVNTLVENPVYQEVRIELKVKFYRGKDENFYIKQLKEDIAKFLSPWAYEDTSEINFGLTLHESTVIYYIEKLNYVDFIKDFQLQSETKKIDSRGNSIYEKVKTVMPANSKVILTSVPWQEHRVESIAVEACIKV